jgi:LysM repeat protein
MYALAADRHLVRRARPAHPWLARGVKAALVGGAVLTLSFGLAKAVEGQAPARYEPVTVEPGETLWSIAAERYPGTDVRVKIWQIQQANHLASARIEAGETLKVPTR